jgi:hypothetical protein
MNRKVKVVNHDFQISNDKPWASVTFKDVSENYQISKFFHFTDKARDFTIKDFLLLGIKTKDFSELNRRVSETELGPIMFNTDKVFEVVIESQPDKNGAMRDVVKFINDPEAPRVAKGINRAELKSKLLGFSLEADLMEVNSDIPF